MLTSLRIQNFKSWTDTGPMRLAPITGLFGTNSSGKTSILQMLLLLKQTAESTDRAQVLNLGDERALVDLGTFRDVVHGHQQPGWIEWALSWRLNSALRVPDPERPRTTLFTVDRLGFTACIETARPQSTPRPVVHQFAYEVCDDRERGAERRFGMRRKSGSSEQYEVFAKDFDLHRFPGRPSPLPPPVKCYGFPDQVYGAYQNTGFLADLQLAFEELFARVYYLGPLRDYPRRQYIWAGAQPSDMGQRGEHAVDALLAARDRRELIWRGERRRRRPHDWIVADWLKKLGLIHSFSVAPIVDGSNLYQVRVQKTEGAPDVLITEVGFGVSQILPVLVLCYYVPEGSTVILEQPEIHLHPAVQAGLADVLIDATETRDIQIILESHSEHLLRRLQRRIAEAKLKPEEAALYFCQIDQGTSRLTPLALDDFGNITNWPDGFFGDELGELVAMTEAASARQMAEAGR